MVWMSKESIEYVVQLNRDLHEKEKHLHRCPICTHPIRGLRWKRLVDGKIYEFHFQCLPKGKRIAK